MEDNKLLLTTNFNKLLVSFDISKYAKRVIKKIVMNAGTNSSDGSSGDCGCENGGREIWETT